jgi:TIR domain-containing protein/protein kinase-like protein
MSKLTRDKVFISYSHKDTKWRDELDTHLKPFVRDGSVISWSDKQISPGSQWLVEIKSAMADTKIAVLLVSADFLASDFIHRHELGPLLKEAEKGGVRILWVPVRGSAYEHTPLKNYQAVLDPGMPLAVMVKAKRDEAWVKIGEEIRKAVNSPDELRELPHEPPPLQLEQPNMIAGIDTAVAAEVLAEPQRLAASEMSTVFIGSLPPYGKVIMKIIRESSPESDEWIASTPYRVAIGDRFISDGTTRDGFKYLLFRFIDGVSLVEVVRPGNVIRGALLDEIIMQLLRQLSALNTASNVAVHRDVTPDNLLLTIEVGRPIVRLIDYESGCFSTAFQNPIGSFAFTAPEQESGHAVPSSDLYSLISTVYYLATADIPARAGPSAPRFPANTFGHYTEFEHYSFADFERCWSPDPAKRPASATAFLVNRRIGSSRIRPAVQLGTFACGSNFTFELFDRDFRLLC